MNIQRSTLRAQLPSQPRVFKSRGCSKLNVECWAFLLLVISSSSLHAQTVTNDLPKLVPAYGELSPTFWEQHQAVIIVSGFALLAVIVLSLLVMLRPKTPVVQSPEAVARQALSKLQGRPEDGKLLSEVSQILRHYIGAAFELSSAEMTTTEFSTAIATNQKIGDELARAVSSFLRECDERKFSQKYGASSLNAANRALELIDLTEKRRVQPEVIQQ